LISINKINNSGLTNISDNEMIVYPNPTTGEITVTFDIKNGMVANLGFYDMSGKKCIDVITDKFPKGKYAYTVSLGNLPTGTYIAVLAPDAQQKLITQKVIKK
jgi:hypothetical protein